jgi:hypothetical protein
MAFPLCAGLATVRAGPGNDSRASEVPESIQVPDDTSKKAMCQNRKSSFTTSEFSDHACGNGIRVRLSYGGGILVSKDGNTWVEQQLPLHTFLRGLTFGQGVFVAVGGSYIDVPGVIMTSNDGIHWIRRYPQNRINLSCVTYGHGLFVAAGDAGTIFTSQDAIFWKKHRSGTSAALATIAFGNGIFVAGGESGTILTSTNGISWANQSLGDSLYVGRVFYRDSLFLAADSEAVFTSVDGRSWFRGLETVKLH